MNAEKSCLTPLLVCAESFEGLPQESNHEGYIQVSPEEFKKYKVAEMAAHRGIPVLIKGALKGVQDSVADSFAADNLLNLAEEQEEKVRTSPC